MKSVISVDLGATNLRVGVVNEDLSLGVVLREPSTKNNPDALYNQIKRMIIEVLKTTANDIKYVGISACGIVKDNVIEILANLGIGRFDLKSLIEKDFQNLSVEIANDANAAGYMESLHGSAANVRTSYFITISSGIGGVLIYDNKMVDLPFEIGHNFINYKNKFYELEKLCSGNGIVNLAKLNGLEVKNAGDLFSLKVNGDKKASKVYDLWLQYISSAIANIQLNYNPDVIVLSGGVMKSATIFQDDLLAVANAFIAPFPVKKIKFVQAKFDQDDGLMGGASLALKHL